MTDSRYTAICLLIDRSGSMSVIKDATEQAINDFVAEQVGAEGRRTVRIVTFSDDELTTFCPSLPADQVPPFVLTTCCGTALLDAMGDTMVMFGAELAAMPEAERPGHVVFVVMTDGEENSSTHYTWPQVQEMVAHQENVYGWHVLYLGANQDAIEVALRLGVRRGSSLTYSHDPYGTRAVMDATQSYVATASAGGNPEFTDTDRAAATGQ